MIEILAQVPDVLPILRMAAGAAAGFITYAGYASMAPRSQFFGRTFTRGTDPRMLALTYDDGPNDPYTLHLLDVLAEHNVKATFFLIGRYVAKGPDIVRRIAQAGHVLGNHTYSHPNLIFSPQAARNREIDDCAKAINNAAGAHSNLFRPPFGGRRPAVLRAIRRKGLIPVMWSVSSYDWRDSASAEVIQGNVNHQIKDRSGNVILLHDGSHKQFGANRRATIVATREIIRVCKDEGYQFATISELMDSDPAAGASVRTGSGAL